MAVTTAAVRTSTAAKAAGNTQKKSGILSAKFSIYDDVTNMETGRAMTKHTEVMIP